MNLEELESVMYSLAASTADSVYNNTHRIEDYYIWAVENGLRRTNIIPLDGLNKYEWGKRFVSNYKNKSYTREEVLGMCDELYNYYDKAILLALFEGIKGKGYSELLNLKPGDIKETKDGYEAHLEDGDGETRTISISEELYHYLKKSDSADTYYPNNGKMELSVIPTPMKYQDSPYIFKKINRGVKTGNLSSTFINRKFVMFKDLFGASFLRPAHIEVSGMMHMINELREKDGGFKPEHIHMMAERFQTPINSVGEGRNYTVATRKVNTPEFKKIYGYKVTE